MTLQNALGDIALDATLTDGTQKAQLVDAGGVAVDVSAANALKVDGSAVTQPVSGTVAVTGAVTTDALTDAELRAAAVPVSAAALPLPAGAATEATLTDAVGYLNTAATEVTLEDVVHLLAIIAGNMPVRDAGRQLGSVVVTSAPSTAVTGTVTATQGNASATAAWGIAFRGNELYYMSQAAFVPIRSQITVA